MESWHALVMRAENNSYKWYKKKYKTIFELDVICLLE